MVALLPLLAVPSGSSAALGNAVFVDGSGAHLADVVFEGECNGAATLTVTIHRALWDDVRTVAVTSSATPAVCGGGLSCMDCPPVPFPVVWTMDSGDGSVFLAGGGAGYYDHYQDWPLAWSLQGPFMEGVLEVRGVLG